MLFDKNRKLLMNITRHNYEEFFLLLADGELTEAEQELVLQFTSQHPDLEEELNMLMECRLEGDDIPEFPKHKILKPVSWDIDQPDEIQLQLLDLLDNELDQSAKEILQAKIAGDTSLAQEWETLNRLTRLQSEHTPSFPKEKLLKPTIWNVDQPDTIYVQMMSMLDDELPEAQKRSLLEKIAADKSLQVEWDSLQNAKLPSEKVVFEDKKSLYREKENRRILPWMRWAAAAVILVLLSLYVLPKISSIRTSDPEMAKGLPPAPGKEDFIPGKEAADSLNDTIRSSDLAQQPAKNEKFNIQTKDNITLQSSTPDIAHVREDQKNANMVKDRNRLSGQQSAKDDHVQDAPDASGLVASVAEADNNRRIPSGRRIITVIPDEENSGDKVVPKQLRTLAANQENNKKDLFTTAAYSPNAVEDNTGDDELLYVAGARINKQKVRGIFRGITRSLGRTFTKSKVEPEENTSVSRSL